MPLTRRQSGLSFADRLASAFVSLVAALATCIVLGIAILVRGGPWEAEFWSRASLVAGAVLLGAAVLGFAIGPDRMANAFSIVWGTTELNAWQAFFLVLLVFAVLAALFW